MGFPWGILPPILGGIFGGLFGGDDEPKYVEAPPDWRYEYGRDELWPWIQSYFQGTGALNAPYQNFRFLGPEGSNPITIQRMDPRTRDYLNMATQFFSGAPGPNGQFYNSPSTFDRIIGGIGAGLGAMSSPAGTAATATGTAGAGTGVSGSATIPIQANAAETQPPALQPPSVPPALELRGNKKILPPVLLRR